MAVSKLSDIIPTTTKDPALADASSRQFPARRKARRKKAPARKKTPAKKQTVTNGPWPISPKVWVEQFKNFLIYCGWTYDANSVMGDAWLKHPRDDIWFDEADFVDKDYDTLTDGLINSENADEWYADDTKNVLYKETKLGKIAKWRLEIKLK
jgi:hypothetical protein